MTVLRREESRSRDARATKHLGRAPNRIADPPQRRDLIRRPHHLALRCMSSCGGCALEVERRPDEADEFARDRADHLGRGLAAREQARIPPAETVLRFVGQRDRPPWLAEPSAAQVSAHARAVPVMPGRFDE